MKCFLKCAGVWLAVVFGFMVFAIILIAIPYAIESFWEMFFDKQSFAFALAENSSEINISADDFSIIKRHYPGV